MRGLDKRLAVLEKRNIHAGQQIVRVYDDAGAEYVQLLWRGRPAGKLWPAWMWDAWDDTDNAQPLR